MHLVSMQKVVILKKVMVILGCSSNALGLSRELVCQFALKLSSYFLQHEVARDRFISEGTVRVISPNSVRG